MYVIFKQPPFAIIYAAACGIRLLPAQRERGKRHEQKNIQQRRH
jgi:hypothetical protein